VRFFRRRKMRLGEATAYIIGVAIIGLIGLASRKPKLSPGQQLNVLRMKIVRVARDVREAHELKILDDAGYTRAKEKIAKASRGFNTLVRKYNRYGKIARSEKQQVVALLVAAVQATREVRDGR
jgi:hypothetical protein